MNKNKNRFKINKLYLYPILNSFNLNNLKIYEFFINFNYI